MSRLRSLQGFGASSLLVGAFLFWFAFQRQMCSTGPDVSNHCGPNFIFLIPGIILSLVGIGLLLMALQRYRSAQSSNVDG